MKLDTGDIITLEGVLPHIFYERINLDINKQRMYWMKYNRRTVWSSLISSDYDGNNRKIIVTRQQLNQYILGVSGDSIFVMKNDEARILMINETEKKPSRSFIIENSSYYDLIVFNNNFNHTSGK